MMELLVSHGADVIRQIDLTLDRGPGLGREPLLETLGFSPSRMLHQRAPLNAYKLTGHLL